MFGRISKFFKRSAPKQPESPFVTTAPKANPASKASGRANTTAFFRAKAAKMAFTGGEGDILAVPFAAILPLLPKELLGRTTAGAESHSYRFPKAVALEQLSRGAVKVQFGDLRKAAPSGVFATGSSNDSRLVDLPLREILGQINPEAFARRPDQNRITVPDDVSNLFGSRGERLADLRVLDKSELKQTPATPQPVAPATPIPTRVPLPTFQQRQPAPTTAPAQPPSPIPFPSMGAVKPTAPAVAKTPQVPLAPGSGRSLPKVPAAPPAVPRPPAPNFPLPSPTPAVPLPAQAQTAPSAAAQPAAPAAARITPEPGVAGTLTVSISMVGQQWPESIRKLISDAGATDLEVPMALVQPALKLGRVEFPWQQVVTWLRPQPDSEPSLAEGETLLDMPLKVIAPLFLQKQKFQAKKSSVPQDIPDLFNAKGEELEGEEEEVEEEAPTFKRAQPQPPAKAPAPVAAPAPARAPSPAPIPAAPMPVSAVSVISDRKKAQSLGELFAEPTKKSWTPNEIVQKTITLPGVSGALIALQDGLLVAGTLPAPWKTETIAAFIPQIFGRLTQYTKELQMGDVRTVSFGVDSGTLQIFNAGIIYFASLGQGGSLPVDDLTLIANELSRHTK